jgi:predicted metal-dependent phosphoesterase TrpH
MISHPHSCAIDFHMHTHFSKDCALAPKTVIEMARNRGLAGIAITDHDTEEGGLATVEANRHKDFLVIPGAEIKTDRGDLIGLFLKHAIKSRKFDAVLDEIAAQGGFSYVPHPLRTFGSAGFVDLVASYPNIDAFEVLNGRYEAEVTAVSVDMFRNLPIRRALSGSDAHMPWDIGAIRTLMPALPRDAEELRTLLSDAVSVGQARSDFAISSGIYFGSLIRSAKTGRYGSAALQLARIPLKGVRYAWRMLGSK